MTFKFPKGLFIKTTESDHPVSGGTKGDSDPFVFRLFDTGDELVVATDIWYDGDGEEKGKAAKNVSSEI